MNVMRLLPFIMATLLALMSKEAQAIILYRVSGISDFNLPSWNIGDGAISAHIDICVHTTLLGPYSVTVSSPGGYRLSSGANIIPYALRWEDSGAGSLGSDAGSALTNGVALSNQQHANSSLLSTDCSTGSPAGPTARLYLDISDAAMTAALAGTYQGTITIMVGP